MSYIQTLFNENILALFPHPYLLPFFGAIIGGEETILLIAALAADGGALTFLEVFIFSFIGTLASDTFWFLFGLRFASWIEARPRMHKRLEAVEGFVHRFTRGQYFLALMVTKFLYGTRIAMIFFLANKRMTFRQFSAQNFVVTLIWSTVVCSIGWLAGKGISSVERAFGSLTIALSAIVFILVVVYVVRIWLNRKVVENR